MISLYVTCASICSFRENKLLSLLLLILLVPKKIKGVIERTNYVLDTLLTVDTTSICFFRLFIVCVRHMTAFLHDDNERVACLNRIRLILFHLWIASVLRISALIRIFEHARCCEWHMLVSYTRVYETSAGCLRSFCLVHQGCETSAGCLRSIYPSLGMRQLFGDVTIGQWRHN